MSPVTVYVPLTARTVSPYFASAVYVPSGAKVTAPKLNGRSAIEPRPCQVPEMLVAQPAVSRQVRLIMSSVVVRDMLCPFEERVIVIEDTLSGPCMTSRSLD